MTFNEAVSRFNKTCQTHREFGTCDTEPQYIFRSLIRRALKGESVTIPRTAQGWELYSSMEGADIVATTLANDAHDAVEMAKKAAEIVEYCDFG
jgi:hypothetical protein